MVGVSLYLYPLVALTLIFLFIYVLSHAATRPLYQKKHGNGKENDFDWLADGSGSRVDEMVAYLMFHSYV